MSSHRPALFVIVLVTGLCLSSTSTFADPEDAKSAPSLQGQPGSQPGSLPGKQPGATPTADPFGQLTPPPEARGDRLTSVGQAMDHMERSLDHLKGALDKRVGGATAPTMDDMLRMVNEIERGCVAAKGMPVPNNLLRRAADAAAQAKLTDAYRKHLIATLRQLLDLEDAISDGRNDDAMLKVAALAKQRDTAHKDLGVGEDNWPFP